MRLAVVLSAVAASMITFAAVAGPLNPPGPPASTYKTLQEVEPRMPLDAVPGDAGALHRITEPGSYYLTGALIGAAPGQEGVVIEASNVALDLAGFVVDGQGVGGEGILIAASASDVVIRNGAIRNWGAGGVVAIDPASVNCVAEDLTSAGNVFEGVLLRGRNSAVRRCIASGNSAGIVVGDGGSIIDCNAERNASIGLVGGVGSLIRSSVSTESGFGAPAQAAPQDDEAVARRVLAGFDLGSERAVAPCVMVASDSLVIDCVARLGGGDGFSIGPRSTIEHSTASDNAGDGFLVGADSAVKGVTGSGNGARGLTGDTGQVVTDSTFARNGTEGVFLSVGSRLSNCAVTANMQSGVSIRSWCFIEGNMIQGNGQANADAAGVLLRDNGTSNRIDGNHLVANPWGIRWVGAIGNDLNVVVRNTVRGAAALNQQIDIAGNITDITNTTSTATGLNYANIVQ